MNRDRLVNQLILDEGMKLYAYQDSLGYTTIGIGRLIDRRKNGGITVEEAKYLLNNDIETAVKQLDEHLPWWRNLTDARQEVLVNMTFNLGIDGLLKFANTLASMHAEEYAAAAAGMRHSRWATQVGARAERLAHMMETGED